MKDRDKEFIIGAERLLQNIRNLTRDLEQIFKRERKENENEDLDE
jgi:hypothetical protein